MVLNIFPDGNQNFGLRHESIVTYSDKFDDKQFIFNNFENTDFIHKGININKGNQAKQLRKKKQN